MESGTFQLRNGDGTMRVDAHQHFWQYNPAEHTWMTEKMMALRHDFLPADLEPLLKASGFDGCITVQVRQSLEETCWLLELAEQNDFVKGVVGWVDLCSPDLPEQLERFEKHPKLVGVRHLVQDEPDDEFLLREEFGRGIARLAASDLTYDLLLYPRHLRAAVKLVAEFPDQSFVLDHIAKPSIAAGLISPWEQDLRELAMVSGGLPRSGIKISRVVCVVEEEAEGRGLWSCFSGSAEVDVGLRKDCEGVLLSPLL